MFDFLLVIKPAGDIRNAFDVVYYKYFTKMKFISWIK